MINESFLCRVYIQYFFFLVFVFVVHILERNLNPKAACLKRREEEKAEDGPKLPQHHMLSNAPYPVGMSASNISFDF